jgi:AraC-like DNA-binding protein
LKIQILQVDRRCGGSSVSTIVEEGTLTFAPAGTEFKWHTRGQIEFAHLYVSPTQMARTALRFDRANELSLVDTVGCRAPLLEAIYLLRRRMAYAQRLLMNTDWPLAKIAERCGFSGAVNFFRSFFRLLQITPTQFRNGRRQKRVLTAR